MQLGTKAIQHWYMALDDHRLLHKEGVYDIDLFEDAIPL